ncbi:MAG TPA: transcription termination/antitermination protein NusG [Patescibacteria group bacterium]|nr:transcription termination/antitermination protein NusG [Patescibacteria group bacterium]
MSRQQVTGERHWYVLHTYSGYEDAVALYIKQRIETMNMQETIFDAIVPKEKKIKIREGKRTTIEEKIFPGYVLVNMIVTDESWYVVRNTPNVTGFVGSGNTPVPIGPEEWDYLTKKMGQDQPQFKVDMIVGDLVKINDGPFKDYEGKVGNVDEAKGKVKVMVTLFGRETPVELDFLQVKKV